MDRDEVIAKLRAVEPPLRAHGVAALYLFGSYARDEARQDSDVDVFVDPGTRDFYSLNHSSEPTKSSGGPCRVGKSATARATACPSTSGPRSKTRRFQQGGHIRLPEAEKLGRFGLGQPATLEDVTNFTDQLRLQFFFLGIVEAEVGEDIPAAALHRDFASHVPIPFT